MLLASLNPAAVASGPDLPDAVRLAGEGVTLSRGDLLGAATSVAERIGGAGRVAILAAIAADIDALAAAWQWTAEDVLVHGLPLFHVHGLVLGLIGSLRVGSRFVHTGKPTPASYGDAAAGGGTLFFGVPTVWSRVAADTAAASALSAARLLVSGSAALPVSVFDRLVALSG
ncbi:MAG: hypothetical protein EBU23_16805, partial [Mycobacteriaceae bacterium]|nr:hypothetical protein [Mycobacteriaceae bacterium]